jgi:hypothetical protein
MAIFDLYSKRQKLLRGEVPEVYLYDIIPDTLKVQIVHIIKDTIGVSPGYASISAYDIYKKIHDILCREYGEFSLGKDHRDTEETKLFNFFLHTSEIDKAIDVIELTFSIISKIVYRSGRQYALDNKVKMNPDEAIVELNQRFKEHGIGYQYEAEKIIRVDSTYIHSEIVKPTLNLLWNNKYKGANEEYLKAHEHYREGNNKECLNECLKAFESVLKIICKGKGWAYKETDSSKKLIQICFDNGIVPSFTQNQFTSLQNLLESGIATIRNKLGGHGQGTVLQKVDDEMTRYALNLTGTNIIFLVEQSGIK